MTLRRVYDSIPARYSACLLLICILSAAKAEDNDNHYPNVIQVNGTGHVTVAPDRADLSLSVEVQAKNAETARNQAAASMTALINAVKNQEVASEDIQTRHVSLHPVYAPSSANKVTGYQLANQVTVVIRDIDKISAIIDGAVMAGGNAVRVQGIRFAVEQPDIALSKAREKAYAAARAKAEQYAKLANVKLGRVVHVSEGDAPTVPAPFRTMNTMMFKGAADEATPIHAGEEEVSVTVNVAFSIIN